MRRRTFIAGLGSAAVWPLATRGQPNPTPVIGFLSSGSPRTFANFLRAFHEGLHEQGFVEGDNVLTNYYWAEVHLDELDALANKLVASHPAVLQQFVRPKRGKLWKINVAVSLLQSQ